MTKRVSSRIPLWAALGTLSALVLGLFTPVGWGTSSASAAGESITITPPTHVIVGRANTLNIVPSGFTNGNYQATVKLVDASGQDSPNGTFAQTVAGLASIPGFDADSGAKLGFSGTLAEVSSALATVSWTPATAANDVRIAVTVASAPGENQFYSSSTGRYYEYVSVPGGITWGAAKSAAASKTAFNLKGYLVHITSAIENEFIANETSASNIWIAATDSAVEGQWRWDGASVTGESDIVFDSYSTTYANPVSLASGYANWTLRVGTNAPVQLSRGAWAANEPNDSGSNQDCALTNWGTKGRWDDQSCTATLTGYLVEYGGRSDDSGTSSAITINSTETVDAIAKPTAPVISAVTAGNQTLSVAFTVASAGQSAISNYRYSTDGGTTFQTFSPAQTASPLTIETQSLAGTPVLQNGTAYSVVIQAVNAQGESASSNAVSGTPAAPRQESNRRSRDDDDEETPATTPSPTNGFTPRGLPGANNGSTTGGTSGTNALSGPFSGPNSSTTPPIQPIAFIGGQPSAVQTSSSGSQQLQVETGGVNLGFGVQSNQGSVTTGPGGSAELGVVNGGTTTLQGSGLQPGSSVQLFLPSLGPSSKPLAQIPVGPNGEFSGDVNFTQSPTGPAMPIGRHVLQVASINAAGERVVVEITVNIAQGDPSPELNRRNGVVPTLTPGQSLATEAGLPVPVTLTVDSSQKSTLIEGEGWTMGFTLLGSEGAVGQTSDGGALMNLVRNSSAEVTGDGFMPGTRLDVFLFSEPTLLGSVTIDDSGAFAGEITIDGRDVPVGNHTLQIQGVGADGFVRASNLGVTVGDPVAVATSTEQAASSFLWWLIAIAILVVLVSLVTWWAFQRRSRGVY